MPQTGAPTKPTRVKHLLDRLKTMESEKQYWLPIYDLCGCYVMIRKKHFTGGGTQGEIQTDDIYDDTAINANQLMSASIVGAVWPNGAKSVQLAAPYDLEDDLEDEESETEEVRSYYTWATRRMTQFMDNPKSGLATALDEYMLDQGSFGISGILRQEEDDPEVPITYKAIDAKVMYIDEGSNGYVDTIYIKRKFKLRQLVQEYGYENISAKWRKLYDGGDTKTEVEVLQAIEPRMDNDPYGFGVKNMPIASIHVDIQTEKIMRESGFPDLPISVTRFWKAMGEKYGRSPAMNALPSIIEANALGEAWILATEKTLDPSLLVMDDGTMGNGVVDTSPGGITVVSVSGRIGGNAKPIEPLFLVGDLQWTAARRTELAEIIKNQFFQDRLMDLNNEQRMTLGEANIRDRLRGQSLNTVFTRQIGEQLVPLVEGTFNSLLRRGFLGVIRGSKQEAEQIEMGIKPKYIPDIIAQRMLHNREAYRIVFISPAARIMQTEELEGIERLLLSTGNLAAVRPDALDNINVDFIVRRMQELTGAPPESILALDAVKKVRDIRDKQMQAQTQSAGAREGSETLRNVAQAAAQAGVTGGQPEQKVA